jgi:AcrR family transcriptional regulator
LTRRLENTGDRCQKERNRPQRATWEACTWRPYDQLDTKIYAMAAQKPRSRQSSLAFERILEVAIEQIASKGIQEVRLAEIAKAADVSVSLIHYHFDTREVLLEQALIQAYRRADRDRELWERAQRDLTQAQRMVSMIDRALPGVDQTHVQEWRLWVELWMQALRVPDLRRVARELYTGWREWWVDAIRTGIATHDFAVCDAESTADRVLAMIDGFGIRAQIDPDVSIEWARAEILDYLAGVLGVPAGLTDAPEPRRSARPRARSRQRRAVGS